MIINEHALAQFRRDRLSPAALLEMIERLIEVLLRLGVGVGESVAIDALLGSPAVYAAFDTVLYVAPMWSVIRERTVVADPSKSIVPMRVFEPRPVERCGQYAKRWDDLEKRGCAALAKATLCKECCAQTPDDPCTWPEQWHQLKDVRLFFATEQQLLLNRSLVLLLKARTNAKRMLVILDEAKILDGAFDIEISPGDLSQLATVLEEYGLDAEAAGWHVDPLSSIVASALTTPANLFVLYFALIRRGVRTKPASIT
jgi:hypothetical protein